MYCILYCIICHIIYNEDVPKSDLYNPIIKIFKNYLNYLTLIRINVNLLLRQETPSISDFHTDLDEHLNKEKVTTAIFYLNTNNGFTEFEDGDKVYFFDDYFSENFKNKSKFL